jgi:hypothetical protein
MVLRDDREVAQGSRFSRDCTLRYVCSQVQELFVISDGQRGEVVHLMAIVCFGVGITQVLNKAKRF